MRFKIVQWNILARALCGEDFFPTVNRRFLSWEHRHLLIQQKFKHFVDDLAIDVIVLEEVDQMTEYSKLLPSFSSINFEKLASPCLEQQRHWGADGSAVFARRENWSIMKSERVILRCDHYHDNQIAVYTELRSVSDPTQQVVVVSCHLKAKDGYNLVRLGQTRTLLNEVARLNTSALPVVICGDFNAEIDEECIGLMREAGFSDSVERSRSRDYFTTCKSRFTDSKNHRSSSCGSGDGAAPATTRLIKRAIDYIWFKDGGSGLTLKSSEAMTDPGSEELPSETFPSDHYPILAEFELR